MARNQSIQTAMQRRRGSYFLEPDMSPEDRIQGWITRLSRRWLSRKACNSEEKVDWWITNQNKSVVEQEWDVLQDTRHALCERGEDSEEKHKNHSFCFCRKG